MTAWTRARMLLFGGLLTVVMSGCSSATTEAPRPSSDPPPSERVLKPKKCNEPRCLTPVNLKGLKGLVPASPLLSYVMPEARPNDEAPTDMPNVQPLLPGPVPMPHLLSEQELHPVVPPTLR